MFDHVTIRVSDLDASRRLYETALGQLGIGEPATDGQGYEWNDFSLWQREPVTRNLHAAFVARSRDEVDEWCGRQ